MSLVQAARTSTPLRLAGGLILIFTIATLIGFGVAYVILREQLGRDIAQELDQIVAGLCPTSPTRPSSRSG